MSNLAKRLIISFVLIILVSTTAAGIPAYWLVSRELDQQAQSRVKDGQHVTAALIRGEEDRLADLISLIAQRPTLKELLRRMDRDDMADYLETLQSSAEVDFLIVYDSAGRRFSSSAGILGIEMPPVGTHYNLLGSGIVMLSMQPIVDDATEETLGYVTGGIQLDNEFAKKLALETGLEQSIVFRGERSSTSLPTLVRSLDPQQVAAALQPQDLRGYRTRISERQYYSIVFVIASSDDEPTISIETLLPIDAVIDAQRRALTVLTLSTLLVVLLGSGLGSIIARRLASPLERLTASAHRISAGDLTTPVRVQNDMPEIVTLAAALEESRMNVQRTLADLSAAKLWSETLIQSITEGVITFDTRGHITFFSEGAERILGYSAQNAVNRPLDEILVLPEEEGNFSEYIPLRGGKRQVTVATQDGRPITVAVTGARLIPPGSSTIQVVLVFRDVTEEEAFRRLQTYFLANITHEFRTPLAALSASIELLLDEAERLQDPALSELMGSVYLSVVRLQTLIDNLLESSSIEAGRFSVRKRSVQLDDVMAEAIRVTYPLLMRRQQTLSVDEPFRLSAIQGDPTRLTQVLVNLISNASKYSPTGSVIDLQVKTIDNTLRLAVCDRGSGIPEAERKNLFRRFMQLDIADSEQYGVGLGLFVAKSIVEGHGGKIGADARPGGGTVFWFTLPCPESNDHENSDC